MAQLFNDADDTYFLQILSNKSTSCRHFYQTPSSGLLAESKLIIRL